MPINSIWKEDQGLMKLSLVLAVAFMLVLLGFYVNFQMNTQEQSRALIYFLMTFVAFSVMIVDFASKKQSAINGLIEFVQFGNKLKFAIAAAVGIVFSLLVAGKLFTSVPLIVSGEALAGISLAFFYAVIVAPYAEEMFFASFLSPTLQKHFGWIGGILATGVGFAFFHGFAYSWNPTMLFTAFIWRVVVLVGNQLLQTTGFSYVAHAANNYLVLVKV